MLYGIGVSRNGILILFAVITGFFISTLPISTISPIVILLFGIVIGFVLIGLFVPEDFTFLSILFFLSFISRILLSFLFYNLSFILKSNYSPGFLLPNDGWSYSEQGWQIHNFAERGIKIAKEMFLWDPNVKKYSGNITDYDFFVSHVYSITDKSPLSLFFISSLAGTLAALFVYFIAKELFSKKAARISAALVFFWPSFIFWSTQNFKDSMIAMLVCVFLWSILYIFKRFSLWLLPLFFIAAWALVKVSIPFAVIIFSMIIFTILFLFLESLFKNRYIALLVSFALFFICIYIFGNQALSFIMGKTIYQFEGFGSVFKFFNYHRSVRAYGSLRFLQNTDISSLGKMTAFLPLGLFYVLFAPFPWQLGSFLQVMGAPETLVFYILFPFTLKGLVFAYKRRFNQSLLFFSIIAGFLLFLALVEGNTGTLSRHRCVLFHLVFIFTAAGLSLKNA